MENIVNEVLSACVSSARAGPIRLKQGERYYSIHGQLHVMLNMPLGTNKSSIMEEIPGRDKYIYESSDYTFPGIIGSISERGKVKMGGVLQAAGKCLWVDEHHSLTSQSRRGLLKMLEQQRYGRDLGYEVAAPFRKRGRYFSICARGGHFDISSRFSCLCTGVFSPRVKIDDKAFLSRFMPLVFDVSTDEAYDMSMGKQPFKVTISPYSNSPVFEDYEKFWRAHKNSFEMLKKNNAKLAHFIGQNPALLRRNLLHFSRLFSYLSKKTGEISDWEKYVPYIPFFLYNYAATSLTLSEFQIMSLLKGTQNQKEISQQLSVSEAYISKVKKRLEAIGLG